MIKTSMFAIVSVLASTQAFAVAVGDGVVLGCTASQNGMTVPFTVSNTVSSIDEASDTINVTATTAVQGQTQSQTSAASLSEYRNYEVATANIDTLCTSIGGTITTVATPVGTLTACKSTAEMAGQPASVYIANVPFTIVKIETNNGQFSCTLQSYKKN